MKSELVDELYDYAVAHPNGYTRLDVERDLEWDHVKLLKVTRGLRARLADDSMTLTCTPTGRIAPWVYRLVGTITETDPWVKNRVHDAETRLATIGDVSTAIVRATDARTRDGRRARIIARHVQRAREDLAELEAETS